MSNSCALCCLPSVKKQKHDFHFFVQCIIKQLLDSVFVISRIIKVSVKVNVIVNELTSSLVGIFIIFVAGFDDQDMERPCFTQPAMHPSVPLLLSKPGVEPVIQVSSKPVGCMSTAR